MSKKSREHETPESFFKLGEEFFRALRKLEGAYKKRIPDIYKIKTIGDYEKVKKHRGYPFLFALTNVKLFLARHSLELLLKSFLLHKGKGIGINELKKEYHHNLVKCLEGVRKYGLKIFVDLRNPKNHLAEVVIKTLNKDWNTTEYKYPSKSESIYSREYLDTIKSVLIAIKSELRKGDEETKNK